MPQNPVTGRHTPAGGPSQNHWDGWNAAVEDALVQIRQNWPNQRYPDAKVEFFATINPGSIVEYSVRITA
jgi:hypothetical protein